MRGNGGVVFRFRRSRGFGMVNLLISAAILGGGFSFVSSEYASYRMKWALDAERQRITGMISEGVPIEKACVGTAYVMGGDAFRCRKGANGIDFVLEYHGGRFTRMTETAVIFNGEALGVIESTNSDRDISAL